MNNYKYITVDGKTYLEHRHVMELSLGRKLEADEVVHHINENKSDNRIENLELMVNSHHSRMHHKPPTMETIVCSYCGKEVEKQTKDLKPYREKGVVNFYCNKKCAGLHKVELGIKPPINKHNLLDIDDLIKTELSNGLTGYAISKKHNLNKKTVYTHINKLL